MTFTPWTWKRLVVDRDSPAGRQLAEVESRFELDFFGAALEHDPENVDLLLELGNLYTRAGRLQKGLEIDERLVELRPSEPAFHYNLACSHALLGQIDGAFRSLGRAISLGYDDLEFLQADSDLDNVRRDDRYGEFLRRARRAIRRHRSRPREKDSSSS